MKKNIRFFLIGMLFALPIYSQVLNTDIMSAWVKYNNAANSLYDFMSFTACEQLDKRANKILSIHSLANWQERQKTIKERLNDLIGPFPKKTPLHAKITGRMQREDYHVEKLIYESQPGFYVTAALFIPENLKGKAPAVIYCSGHTEDGFRSPVYQRVIINLVKKGFVVLAYDPLGQGERRQYFDAQRGKSNIGGPTLEHSYAGAQCFLIGSSLARYMIWDGIRAIDYLLSRPEVDGRRIGITGRSGGGTQSAYIAAMDERIEAAAPECYITSLRRLIESRGLQDAEQNFYHGILNGIDHADLLEARAPKATLVIATTRDFFSIQGVYETFTEAQNIFKAYEKKENLSLSVDRAKHQSTKKNREAMYRFFQKYLQNPGSSADEDVKVFEESELYSTTSGQVVANLNSETVYSLNKKEYEKHFAYKKSSDPLKKALKLSGYRRNSALFKSVFCASYRDSGVIIQKYFIETDGGYPLPFIMLRPADGKKHKALIYLHPQGKKIYEKESAFFINLVRRGNIVLLPDLLGFGEIGGGKYRGDSYGFKAGKANYNLWFYEIQTGRSLCGIHAADISTLIDFLITKKYVNADDISAAAEKELCPSLTYAAAFDNRIVNTVLISPFVSYESLLNNRYYKPQFMRTAVGGMLQYYDLSDLYASIAPRGLLILNMTDHLGNSLNSEETKENMQAVKLAYNRINSDNFTALRIENKRAVNQLLADWIK